MLFQEEITKSEYSARYRRYEHIAPIVVNMYLNALPGTGFYKGLDNN
jgi:hypothetical protein